MNDSTMAAFLVAPSETRFTERLEVLGEGVLVKLSGRDSNGQAAIFHVTVPPMSGPPLHRHSREDEFFYVLEGELTWQIDGERVSGGPGTSAFAPRGSIHTFQNFSEQTAAMMVTTPPAGLEEFFEAIHLAHKGRTEPDAAAAARIMSDYGIDLLGPPLGRQA